MLGAPKSSQKIMVWVMVENSGKNGYQCTHCGGESPKPYLFCGYCGYRASNGDPNCTTDDDAPEKPKKTIFGKAKPAPQKKFDSMTGEPKGVNELQQPSQQPPIPSSYIEDVIANAQKASGQMTSQLQKIVAGINPSLVIPPLQEEPQDGQMTAAASSYTQLPDSKPEFQPAVEADVALSDVDSVENSVENVENTDDSELTIEQRLRKIDADAEKAEKETASAAEPEAEHTDAVADSILAALLGSPAEPAEPKAKPETAQKPAAKPAVKAEPPVQKAEPAEKQIPEAKPVTEAKPVKPAAPVKPKPPTREISEEQSAAFQSVLDSLFGEKPKAAEPHDEPIVIHDEPIVIQAETQSAEPDTAAEVNETPADTELPDVTDIVEVIEPEVEKPVEAVEVVETPAETVEKPAEKTDSSDEEEFEDFDFDDFLAPPVIAPAAPPVEFDDSFIEEDDEPAKPVIQESAPKEPVPVPEEPRLIPSIPAAPSIPVQKPVETVETEKPEPVKPVPQEPQVQQKPDINQSDIDAILAMLQSGKQETPKPEEPEQIQKPEPVVQQKPEEPEEYKPIHAKEPVVTIDEEEFLIPELPEPLMPTEVEPKAQIQKPAEVPEAEPVSEPEETVQKPQEKQAEAAPCEIIAKGILEAKASSSGLFGKLFGKKKEKEAEQNRVVVQMSDGSVRYEDAIETPLSYDEIKNGNLTQVLQTITEFDWSLFREFYESEMSRGY